MEINIKTVEQVTVVEITGDIDGKTAPRLRSKFCLWFSQAAR